MDNGLRQLLSTASAVDQENHMLARRPYLNMKGENVIAVNTGLLKEDGKFAYAEKHIHTNATLRKDEWINLEDAILEAARERLVIIDDMRSMGLTFNVGGLGTIISEWEAGSEMTDATASMDGETNVDRDRQEFSLQGVPIPVIQKPFRIGERVLMASRTRGSSLDVTTGIEAARAVARASEKMVFNGLPGIGTVDGRGIPGLTTFGGRATVTIAVWDNAPAVTPEVIHGDILTMVSKMETDERHFGPFTLYIPAEYAFRFREDFKANSDRTLRERVLAEDVIKDIRISDVLAVGNVLMIQMESSVLDLAIAADVSTVQWSSGSGWTNNFQTFAAWAPRFKQDHDGHSGILHGTIP